MLTGSAWPKVDASAAVDQAQATYPLDVEISSLDGSSTQRESGSEVSVDLSTEVLFGTDSASLTPAAEERIGKAAAMVNQRAAGGTIRVVGHTDNTGSTAHNLDLSKRRAAAVAAVLTPLLTVSGVNVVVEGKGESEPVASNATAEGRQANRRVSIVFTAKN
jgi:outer membrane protein OmpA-like peptidoglycan-associated protein